MLLLTRGRVVNKKHQHVNMNPLRNKSIDDIVVDYSRHEKSREYDPQREIRSSFGLKRD